MELGGARWPGSGGGAGELGRCLMKVMTPGSLIGWAHLSASGRRRPKRTSGAGDGRNGQVAESDKRSRRRPKWTSGRIGQAEQATGRLGWTGREEVGCGWARKKIREEAGPKIRKKEFLN
jgi:hypothetical protein